MRSEPRYVDRPTFDVVVFGEGGDAEERLSFDEFRRLPLRRRVHLLLSKVPRFYLGDDEVPRVEAMRFTG